MGETTSSCHFWEVVDWVEVFGVMGPVGVRIVEPLGEEDWTFWKMWIGRASKNSWAIMNGVLNGPMGRYK